MTHDGGGGDPGAWESRPRANSGPDQTEQTAAEGDNHLDDDNDDDDRRLRRLCLDLSCAGAHMRRGNAASAEPLYRRVLADIALTPLDAATSAERLAFYVEARLGLAEIDLIRLRAAEESTPEDASLSALRHHQRCRHLLRALSHAHAAEDALASRRRRGHQRQQLLQQRVTIPGVQPSGRGLQLRLLSGSVQVKRQLLESRLQGLLRCAIADPSKGDGGQNGGGQQRRRRYNSNSFYNERPFRSDVARRGEAPRRSPSLQARQPQQQRRPRRQQPRRETPVAAFVRQLRDFLARCAAESAAAAVAAVATASEADAQASLPVGRGHRQPPQQQEQLSGAQLDSLINRFVQDSLQSLKNSQSVPRDLAVSSLRRDESGQHYLQYSRQYLSFTQSLASSPSLREDMEAAASGLMGDIRRNQLDRALTVLRRIPEEGTAAATLPTTGHERAAARLARLAKSAQPSDTGTTLYQLHAAVPDDLPAMLKTLLRGLLDIAKAAYDAEQLEEAVDLFDTCLDLCRSLTRELGDTEVEQFEVPKIHRLLGIIHCSLGDTKRGVSMMTFAAELFEKRLREKEAAADEGDDETSAEEAEDSDGGGTADAAALGLAETWYDIGCVLLGCSGDGRCGDLVLGCLSEALRRRCVADVLQQLPADPLVSWATPAEAGDAAKAFERCRGLLRGRRQRRAKAAAQAKRGRRSDQLTGVEVRVTARLADCCFAAGKWDRALVLYEEALALLGDGGSTAKSGGDSGVGGGGGGRVIDHGHVLRMLGCVRLLLLDSRSQAAAVLETALIMFQHLRKVSEAAAAAATEEIAGEAAGWAEEQQWVLAPLLVCHLAGGNHPRALHCARAILAQLQQQLQPEMQEQRRAWLKFFANLAAGRAASRLRDSAAAARHMQVAALAAASASSPVVADRLLACVAEAEAATVAARDDSAGSFLEVSAGHYRRLLGHLAAAAALASGDLRLLRCPTLAAACLTGAELLHDLGQHEASNQLLEAHVRCSPDSPDSLLGHHRLAELSLALGTAAMRCGQWDRALSFLKGALAACARNPEGDVGPEGAPILCRLGTLHHVRYCQERRDILFEAADVQDLQDRCAFNYLQSLELRRHPDCALRLAGFLLATDQLADAERCAAEAADDDGRLEFQEFEAVTLHWGLDVVWPTLLKSSTVFRPLRRALSSALLACCRSHRRDLPATAGHLRRLLTVTADPATAEPDDRLLAGLVLLHHGAALEAAVLLAADADDKRGGFLTVWSTNLALAGLAVAMVTAFCCLIHLTNAMAKLEGSNSRHALDRTCSDQGESTRL